MRTSPTLLLLGVLLSSTLAFTQVPSNSSRSVVADPEITALHAISSFSKSAVHTVQLSGTARALAGSTDETGTFSFELKQNGESTLRLEAGTMSRTESSGSFGEMPECSWSGQNGVKHETANHNCWISVDWILPAFALSSHQADLEKKVKTDELNPDGWNARLELTRKIKTSHKPTEDLLRKLSASSLVLDPDTSLPTALTFNIHPDNDANTDIPIIVRYSNYREVSGASIPFHIQKFLNNGLVLDLTVENAVVQ